jgi:probable HAF family extracellular repeat protein
MRARTIRLTAALLVAAVLALLPSSADAASAARFSSSAAGINNAGQIVGEVHVPDSARCQERDGNVCVHAVVFTPGGFHDLGTLGGPSSRLRRVNDQGIMVGTSDLAGTDPDTGQPIFHAVKATEFGGFVDVGTLGGRNSDGADIDDQGDVVGQAQRADGSYRAFFLPAGGKMRALPLLPGGTFAFASAISNDGHYVVGLGNSNKGFQGFIWDGASIRGLGTLGGGFSVAWGVNNRGQAVGETENGAGATVAFAWQNGVMKAIANFGAGFTRASAINDLGEVVGFGVTPDDRGVVFKVNASGGPVQRFSALTGNFTTAFDINERGQFVGDADRGTRDPHGEPGFDAVLFNLGHVTNLATGQTT